MSDYKINESPKHYDDSGVTDTYQDEVYKFAKTILNEENLNIVVDIGCGSGYKLIKYFNNNLTIGIETEPCISFLRKIYPDKKWVDSGECEKSFPNFNQTCDLIICADLIEHMIDPTELLKYINKFQYKYLIISTPDRYILKNKNKNDGLKSWHGPPLNECHVREWEYNEFTKLLNDYFFIIQGFHAKIQTDCMIFLCKPKQIT